MMTKVLGLLFLAAVGSEARLPPAPKPRATATALKPGPVASSAVAAESSKETTKTASTFKLLALQGAVHSLFVSLRGKPKQEAFDDFLPRCLDHAKSVVSRVDKSYTDIQLEHQLEHQCDLEKEFPHSADHGFNSNKACKDFAKKLTEARMEELENGKTDKYDSFCASYYEHVYPSKKKKKKTEKSGAAQISALAGGALVAALSLALA